MKKISKKNVDKKVIYITYGNKTIRKYMKGNHFHIIIDSIGDNYVSVGLTSDKPNNIKNQQLHKVYESNGKIARLKRNATIDKTKNYQKRIASFKVDLETEKKAIDIANRKLSKKK